MTNYEMQKMFYEMRLEEKEDKELEKKNAPVEEVVRLVEKTVLALDLESRFLVPMHVFEVID